MIEINGKKYKTYDINDEIKEKFHGFIYITINKLDKKKYIGQHTKWNLDYLGSGRYLRRAINKYGRENFERYIIDLAKSQKELDDKETYYINEGFGVNVCISPDWYNIKDGSQSGGNCYSGLSKEDLEKVKNKLRKSYKKRIEIDGRYPFQGRKHNEESKEKISIKLKGKKKPEGMGEKLSKTMRSRTHWTQRLGHSPESNEKRSESLKGKNNGYVNLLYAKLPNGKIIQAYGMREMHDVLLEYGYDIPPRSINTASKSKSKIYKKFGIKFWREEDNQKILS